VRAVLADPDLREALGPFVLPLVPKLQLPLVPKLRLPLVPLVPKLRLGNESKLLFSRREAELRGSWFRN
jgi:hypothetical protein